MPLAKTMALSQDKLAAVKAYMRVDGEDDDPIIAALYAAAELYLKNAGAIESENNRDLYNLAVWSLTLHYYDHRDDVGNESSFPLGIRPIITQLKLVAKSVTTTQ